MLMLTFICILLALICFGFAYFFGRELLKKFVFLTRFAQTTTQEMTWKVPGQAKPHMRNIVLRAPQPFAVLVGVELRFAGIPHPVFDPYRYVQSDAQGVAVFSTYVGKNNFNLKLLVNDPALKGVMRITSSDEEQKLEPSETYPPHWFQRLGIFK